MEKPANIENFFPSNGNGNLPQRFFRFHKCFGEVFLYFTRNEMHDSVMAEKEARAAR